MKALILESVGNLVYKDVPTPTAKPGEVLLKVRACGICSSDFDRCLKTGTYHFPTIPGHEFSGEIVAVGDSVDASCVGRRAVAFPLLPCKRCDQCRIEAYARCRNYSYLGSRCDGAFAEFVAVPFWNIQFFDDGLDFKVAALCEPASVAHHAVAVAEIDDGDRVCVVGTGPIGVMVGLWARDAGAKVTFVCRAAAKWDFLTNLGFEVIEHGGSFSDCGFSRVFECVGSNQALETALSCASTSGKVVLIGNPDGDRVIDRNVFWKILRNELVVKGVWNSSYSSADNDWRQVLKALASRQGTFAGLITSVFPLSAGLSAFAAMRNSGKLEFKGMFVNE